MKKYLGTFILGLVITQLLAQSADQLLQKGHESYYNFQHTASTEYFEKALQGYFSIRKKDKIMECYYYLGMANYELENITQALDFTIEAMEYGEEQFDEDDPNLAGLNILFGKLYHYNQDYDSSILFYDDAISLLSTTASNKLLLGEAYANRGYARDYGEYYQGAVDDYIQAITILTPVLGESSPYVDWLLGSVSYPASKASLYKLEVEYALKSLNSSRKIWGSNNEDEAHALRNVAVAYEHLDDYVHAKEYFEKAYEIYQNIYTSGSLEMANHYYTYGNILAGLNETDRAVELANQSYQIRRKLLGKNHPDTYDVFQNIGNIYYDGGDYETALNQYLEAKKLLKSLGSQSAEVRLIKSLADTYEHLGDYENMKHYLDQLYNTQKQSNDPAAILTLIAYSRHENYFSRLDKALSYLNQAMEQWVRLTPEDLSQKAFILNNLGTVYKQMSQYDSARASYEEALQIRASIYGIYSMEYEQSLTNYGNLLSTLEQNEAARDTLTRALEIVKTNLGSNHPAMVDNLINLSAVIGNLGNLEKELEMLQEAYGIASRTYGIENPEMISIYHNLALVLSEFGRSKEAEDYISKAKSIILANYGEASIQLATNYNNQQVIKSNAGQKFSSIELQLQAMDIYKKVFGDHPSSEVALLYNNLGASYLDLNEYTQAELYLNRSLDLYDQLFGVNHPASWATKLNIAQLYYQKSQYDRAIDQINKSLQLGNVGLPEQLGAYTLLASCYTSSGKLDDAIHTLQKTRSLAGEPTTVTEKLLVADMHNNLGANYFQNDQFKDALLNWEITRDIYHSIYQAPSYQLALIHNNLSDVYRANKQWDKALEELKLSASLNLENGQPKGDPVTYFLTLVKEVDLLFIQYEQSKQKKYLTDAEPLLAEARKVNSQADLYITSDDDKVDYSIWKSLLSFIGIKNAYYLYQETNQSKYLDDALRFAEEAKANVLLASLGKSNVKQISGVDSKLLVQQLALKRTIQKLREELFKNAYKGDEASSTVSAIEQRLIGLNESYRSITQQINEQQSKKWIKEKSMTIASVQQSLDTHEAIVEYAVSDSSLFVMTITKEEATIDKIPFSDHFSKLVGAYRNAIYFRQDASLPVISRRITDLIWKPVNEALANQSEITKLTIVPEGSLNYLPFEALLYNNQYLIERYEISYSYSIRLKDWLQSQPDNYTNDAMFAVAPVFSDESLSQMTSGAKDVFEASRAISTETTRGFTLRGDFITPLPATANEVEAIDAIAKEQGKPSSYYLEAEANEAFVKQKITEGYRFLHFATHGFVNEANPAFSGIFLSQQADEKEDCILFASEIYGLELNTDLVTLSACETGLGRFAHGEGIVGLTRAFLYAGANNLLVSQWQVDDRSTSELMIDFYKLLFANSTKSEALRQAKINLITSEDYSDPYFWAPFVLIGE